MISIGAWIASRFNVSLFLWALRERGKSTREEYIYEIQTFLAFRSRSMLKVGQKRSSVIILSMPRLSVRCAFLRGPLLLASYLAKSVSIRGICLQYSTLIYFSPANITHVICKCFFQFFINVRNYGEFFPRPAEPHRIYFKHFDYNVRETLIKCEGNLLARHLWHHTAATAVAVAGPRRGQFPICQTSSSSTYTWRRRRNIPEQKIEIIHFKAMNGPCWYNHENKYCHICSAQISIVTSSTKK